MVDIIRGCRPGTCEFQGQVIVLRKSKQNSDNRSCHTFAFVPKGSTEENVYSNHTKISSTLIRRHKTWHLLRVKFTRNDRVSCFESDVNKSSSSAESEPANYFTETGLEVVNSLEEAEAEGFKAILNQDRISVKTPIATDRESSQTPSLPEAGNGESPLSREDSCPESSRLATTVEGGTSVEENREGKLFSGEKNAVSSPVFEDPILLTAAEHELGKNMVEQMREILVFAGPALGIWLSGPMMSLIDTSVIGTSSSLELAALGPGTVLCDQLSYVFMFLSVATSNLIATSLAKKDEAEVASHLSRLLFVSLACGLIMFLFTEAFTTTLLQAFVGAKNSSLVPAARTYVKIRGWAWPAVLVGLVAQSASFGMQDSWGPLKVLAVASLVNAFGDILLCTFLGFGIAGAAWATMVSQYIAGILMLVSLWRKGYNVLALKIPNLGDLLHMVEIAAPVLLTMFSRVLFYTLMTYLATSLGATTLAAHQVMLGIYSLCVVWGEPLAQTAQSFMPKLIRGANRNLRQAWVLLDSLLMIGALVGLILGIVGISIPWFLPQLFTKDLEIVTQMRRVTFPCFCSILITAPTLSLEGTLMACRDLRFLGLSMASCFCTGSVLLLAFNRLGFGLLGSWWILALFLTARFLQSYSRVKSPGSLLNEDKSSANHVKWKSS